MRARQLARQAANPTDQIVAHTLGFSSSAVNLSWIFFEQLHPILDIGRAALRVMSYAHALTRSSWR